MKMYGELAEWWPLLSPPEDYAEEAAIYQEFLIAAGDEPCATLLELGSGGGNNASHMKRRFEMTLVDPAEGMLAVSRRLNPEIEHIAGDMRTVRVGRQFDRVFIHDAICYMTSPADLLAALRTAFEHCRPGGGAVFTPDAVRETFEPGTDCGGCDGDGRAMRYLEWTWDPDPDDCTYVVDYILTTRDGQDDVRVAADRHVEGIFRREEWLNLIREAGFEPRASTFRHSEVERELDVFLGVRPR